MGEKQTYQGPSVYGYTPYGGALYSSGAYHPSVRPHKVSKTNPVRLPNLSGNAYLLFIDQGAKYYYLDVSVDNGAVFRIVKVSGAP